MSIQCKWISALYIYTDVRDACVTGLPEKTKVKRKDAFVMLKYPVKANDATTAASIDHCRENLIKRYCLQRVEFKETMQLARVGETACAALAGRDCET